MGFVWHKMLNDFPTTQLKNPQGSFELYQQTCTMVILELLLISGMK